MLLKCFQPHCVPVPQAWKPYDDVLVCPLLLLLNSSYSPPKSTYLVQAGSESGAYCRRHKAGDSPNRTPSQGIYIQQELLRSAKSPICMCFNCGKPECTRITGKLSTHPEPWRFESIVLSTEPQYTAA